MQLKQKIGEVEFSYGPMESQVITSSTLHALWIQSDNGSIKLKPSEIESLARFLGMLGYEVNWRTQ